MCIVTVIAGAVASRGAVQLALYLPALPFLVEFLLNEHYYAELMYLSGLYCVQLLCLTLCVTPLRLVFTRLAPATQAFLLPVLRWLVRFRRQFGIATFSYGLIHTGIYIQYNTSLADILAEAVRVKNLTTRRHGFSAQFLAFGFQPDDRIVTPVSDLVVPSADLSSMMRKTCRVSAGKWLGRPLRQACFSLF